MNLKYHDEKLTKLLSERNAWMTIAGVLAVSIVVLGFGLLTKQEKTILVPPIVHKSFWVQGDEVSKEYLEEMSLYMAKLLLDLTPSSLHHSHTVVLRYATPEAYGRLKAQFLKEEAEYGSLQLSTFFKPSSVSANPQTLTAEVKGTLTRYVAGKELRTSTETLLLKFANRGSGLLLESAQGGLDETR